MAVFILHTELSPTLYQYFSKELMLSPPYSAHLYQKISTTWISVATSIGKIPITLSFHHNHSYFAHLKEFGYSDHYKRGGRHFRYPKEKEVQVVYKRLPFGTIVNHSFYGLFHVLKR